MMVYVLTNQGKPVTFKHPYVLMKKCVPDGDYQQRKGKRSEIAVPRAKIRGLRKYDKVRYLDREYFIKGRMKTGYAILMDIYGSKQQLGHTPKMDYMIRLSSRRSNILTSEPLLLDQTIQY
ncbi:MAG: hypothetical protein ACFFC7_15735 [Candidatus Hermodarchaeota archaeon]